MTDRDSLLVTCPRTTLLFVAFRSAKRRSFAERKATLFSVWFLRCGSTFLLTLRIGVGEFLAGCR